MQPKILPKLFKKNKKNIFQQSVITQKPIKWGMCVIHIKILQLEPNSNVTATAAPLTSSLPYSTPQIINRSSVIPQTLVQPGSHLSQPGRRYP